MSVPADNLRLAPQIGVRNHQDVYQAREGEKSNRDKGEHDVEFDQMRHGGDVAHVRLQREDNVWRNLIRGSFK